MTVHTERIEGEPIIVSRFSGEVVIEDVYAMYESTLQFQQEIGGKIFRISHIDDVHTNFPVLMDILRVAAQKRPGSGGDPNITLVFAGTSSLARMIKDALSNKQFGGDSIPLFPDVTEALIYLRLLITGDAPPPEAL